MAEKLLVSPDEGCETLGIKRSKMFQLLASGEIPSIKIGRLRRIPLEALYNWVTTQVKSSNGVAQEK
jgi:excisionase family DNA binding protein